MCGDALAAGEFAVEGDVHHRTQPQRGAGDDERREHGQRRDVGARDRHDAAEEVSGQIARRVARTQAHEEYAERHADRPDDADGRILADAAAVARPFDAERRENGEDERSGNGIQSQIEGDAQPAERRMGDAARQKDRAATDDVGAHDPAGDARKDAGRERVVQIGVAGDIVEKLHRFTLQAVWDGNRCCFVRPDNRTQK